MWQRNRGVRRTEKAKGGCMLFAGSEMERRLRSSLIWRQGKKVLYGGVEMMIKLVAWGYW